MRNEPTGKGIAWKKSNENEVSDAGNAMCKFPVVREMKNGI